MKKTIFLLLAQSLLISGLFTATSALACTTILVDKGATVDGGYIVARNDDSNVFSMPRFYVHPRQNNDGGDLTIQGFTYPLPKVSLGYTSMSNFHESAPEERYKGESGFNENGVGVSATETIFASKKVLAVDPYVESGIQEFAMVDVLLPRIKTAREGVLLLGNIVETKGSAEGFGVAFMDKNELWYFENGSGHQWMATRIPANKYFVTGNQGRLSDFNERDTRNFLGSKTLISFAKENGLYDGSKRFSFKDAYIQNETSDVNYNYTRVWAIQHLYNPNLKTTINDSWDTATFMAPSKKLSINDIKKALRNRYEGTSHDPYINENPKESYRPIAVFRAEESHIMQVRPKLPQDIGAVNYVTIGMQLLSPYIPYYQGMDHYLPNYDNATNRADDNSVVWKYRKLQSLAMQNFKKYYPIVSKAYNSFEVKIAREQKLMEKEYLSTYKKDLTKARAIIQKYEDQWMKEGIKITETLTEQLLKDLNIQNPTNEFYQRITKEVADTYTFHGA